jgi:hypothetical protein
MDRIYRKQHNDLITKLSQINFCYCCYFWGGGCDWLRIFALRMTPGKYKIKKQNIQNQFKKTKKLKKKKKFSPF